MPGPSRGHYAVCFVFGLVAFLFGLVLDAFTAYPQWIPDYTAAHVMPAQMLLGLVLVASKAFLQGRTGFMAMWHAALAMLLGLVVSWITWMVVIALFA